MSKLIGSENPVVARVACFIGLFGLTAIWISILVGILGGWSGSDGHDKSEAFANDSIQAWNDLADAMESVKDPASAKAAAVKINEVSDRLVELTNRAKDPPKVTTGSDRLVQLGFDLKINEAMERFKQAASNAKGACGGDPDFVKAVHHLKEVIEELEKVRKG